MKCELSSLCNILKFKESLVLEIYTNQPCILYLNISIEPKKFKRQTIWQQFGKVVQISWKYERKQVWSNKPFKQTILCYIIESAQIIMLSLNLIILLDKERELKDTWTVHIQSWKKHSLSRAGVELAYMIRQKIFKQHWKVWKQRENKPTYYVIRFLQE